jgi:hypothetical protein
MLLRIDNQVLKQAEKLKSNWKLKEALNVLDNFEINQDLTNHQRYQFYFLKSSILFDILSSNEALKYADLAYKVSKKLGSDYLVINTLILKAQIFASLVDPKKQLEAINEAEEILANQSDKSTNEFQMMKAQILYRKGTYNFSIGNLIRCLDLLDKASQIASKINDKNLILLIIKWYGITYDIKGENDRALEFKKQYLRLAIKLNDKQEIIGAHNSLGMQFSKKGDNNRAIYHLKKGLSICKQINSWKTFVVSSSLFEAYMEANYIEKAQQLHDEMGELVAQGTFKFNIVAYRLQEAALLKRKLDKDSLSKAEKIYKEFADRKMTFIEFKIDALVNLCDLYLIRLKETSNLKEMDKIQFYIDKIRSIAEDEEVYSLLVEMNLLDAKLMLLIYNFKEAQQLLTRALDIAIMYSLNFMIKRVNEEQIELSKNFIKWENLKVTGGKLAERMDLARIDEQIRFLLQKREYLRDIIRN